MRIFLWIDFIKWVAFLKLRLNSILVNFDSQGFAKHYHILQANCLSTLFMTELFSTLCLFF